MDKNYKDQERALEPLKVELIDFSKERSTAIVTL